MKNTALLQNLKFAFFITASVTVSACQTLSVKEEKLVLAPGFFQPADMTRGSAVRKYTKDEWITADSDGRSAEVAFQNGSARGGVFTRGKLLSIFVLRAWKRLKDADISRGTEGKVETPLGGISYQRFDLKGKECFYFRYLFGYGMDDNGRNNRSVTGYFCEPANIKLTDKVISQFLHQVGVTRYYDPTPTTTVQTSSSAPQNSEIENHTNDTDKSICLFALHNKKSMWSTQTAWTSYVKEAKERNLTPQVCTKLLGRTNNLTTSKPPLENYEVRPIAVSWEGYSELIAGTVRYNETDGNGVVSISLPDGKGTCTGRYDFAKDNSNSAAWAVACTNNLAASGFLKGLGKDKGAIGEGTDTQGRKVKFTLGAKPSS